VRLPPYSFSDFDRRLPMIGLGIMFVVLLLATGKLHGLRALIGLGASLLIVLKFVIPSILLGHSAVRVALAGALAVMLVTIPLSYGLGAKAIAAWLGTAASLLLAAGPEVRLAAGAQDRFLLLGRQLRGQRRGRLERSWSALFSRPPASRRCHQR